MKATGIVRRIDDLGRVVIPKEIRRTMRLRDGDQLATLRKIGCDYIQGYIWGRPLPPEEAEKLVTNIK